MECQKMFRYKFGKKYGWRSKNDFVKGFKITYEDFINKKIIMKNKNRYNYKLLLNKKRYIYTLTENTLDKKDLNQGIKVIKLAS